MINFIFYPLNEKIPSFLLELVNVFKNHNTNICSPENSHESNKILNILSEDLIKLGYLIELSKKKDDKISVPVLFGLNGEIAKKFEADAYHKSYKTVLEIEAGRGYTNNQFLKDYFQACMMLDVEYFVVAIRNDYRGHKDFQTVKSFFDALYASHRIKTELKGVLVVGY